MANTLSTKTLRDKYRAAQVMHALRKSVVAEKVCIVDSSDLKTISSPYLTEVATVAQAVAGTYSPAAITTTDDTLTVADEFIASTHIFHFEEATSNFDLFFTANKGMTNALTQHVDKWVLNCLCEDGTGAMTTPAGGFTTPANVVKILGDIQGLIAGYADAIGGAYVVLENTDLSGVLQSQAAAGFNFADAALNNGFIGNMLGVDIYVVRSGTFVDAATTAVSGSKTWTNAGHRVGGAKNVSTYARPRWLTFEEKGVTGKTGMEVAMICYAGFKQWTPLAGLTIDITLA